MRASLDGGGPVSIGPGTSNNGAIAADGTAVYYANGCNVSKAPLDGGSNIALGAMTNPGICLPVGGPSIAIDGTNAYWAIPIDPVPPSTPQNSGTIQRAPVSGSGPTVVLATGQNAPNNVAVDATHVHWTNHGINGLAGQVMKAPK